MSWQIGILAALLLILLNKFRTPAALKKLKLVSRCDHVMAEPGETVTWLATVENHSRIPAPFVRVRQIFPGNCHPIAEKRWIDSHCQSGLFRWTAEERLSVLGRQSNTRRMTLSFDRRGAYRIGDYHLAVGDLLGIGEAGAEGSGQDIVIIPACSRNPGALRAVGGILGDISVRRFLFEDPVLSVGFRDYTGREPLKAVSWTRTAMTGSLQVKQFDHTAEQTVMILLNVEGGTPEQLEECFSLARMACEQLEKQKIPYGFRTNGNLIGPVGKLQWMAEGLGSSHLSTILYALGRADYTCFYSLRYLVTQTLHHRKRGEAYIVITPFVEEQERALIQKLEAAAGCPVCILSGEGEGENA